MVRIEIELLKMVGEQELLMAATGHRISVTMLLIMWMGPAITLLELATEAERSGMVVGAGADWYS